MTARPSPSGELFQVWVCENTLRLHSRSVTKIPQNLTVQTSTNLAVSSEARRDRRSQSC